MRKLQVSLNAVEIEAGVLLILLEVLQLSFKTLEVNFIHRDLAQKVVYLLCLPRIFSLKILNLLFISALLAAELLTHLFKLAVKLSFELIL